MHLTTTQVLIVACPAGMSLTTSLDGIVLEEDTYLVMSADAETTTEAEAPARILRSAVKFEPKPPGSVILERATPLRLLAVVHDLDHESTSREEWVASALAEVLLIADRENLSALALPMLGAGSGGLTYHRFAELLTMELHRAAPVRLRHIWLAVPPEAATFDLEPLAVLGAPFALERL